SVVREHGYEKLVVGDLTVDGERTGGNAYAVVSSEEIETGDVLTMSAVLVRYDLPETADGKECYAFVSDVRYRLTVKDYAVTGKRGVFLRLNAALYRTLTEHMTTDEANVSFALLTGNGGALDDGFSDAVRKGGIAHIFAVSGLHIGILFGAAYLLFRPIGKYRIIPALTLATAYVAFCGFTVSSVRAAVMCAVAGLNDALGRKKDLAEATGFAATAVLLVSPKQWLSVGFRLSFGACLGLALFYPSLSRLLRRLPKVGGYLSANVSVQLFTFPVLVEAFGYWSVWGTVLNFFLIPLLPVLFLGLVVCAALALVLPAAAAFFLALPAGMISALVYLFSVADLSCVLTGFSLGAGAGVWYFACPALSGRFRLNGKARAAAAGALILLFAFFVIAENVVFAGCKIVASDRDGGNVALIRTPDRAVLVVDDQVGLSECREFLAHTYGGRLDAVLVLGEDEARAISVAAFLGAEEVRACDGTETGLRETRVLFGERFAYGELQFRYEGRSRLVLIAQSCSAEFSFGEIAATGADLSFEGGADLIFYLRDGIIKSL
ncbi:MAG: ComEC/Rec2 family competence protein, partial [Candidatus Gallimonas sp.]